MIVRLSHVPSELLDDRGFSGPRGMALKPRGVDGPMLTGHEGEVTQDFVLDTGSVFNAVGLTTFFAEVAPIDKIAARRLDAIKVPISTLARTATPVCTRSGWTGRSSTRGSPVPSSIGGGSPQSDRIPMW